MTIEELETRWQDACARGDHAAAYAIEQEIDALKRQGKREVVQQQAEAAESRRRSAVDAAKATLKQIEQHKIERTELERLVVELESAAAAVDTAMARLRPAWTRCRNSYPIQDKFTDPAQQGAYDEALGNNRYPSFEPLRIGLRLPAVLSILRDRANRGLGDILSVPDARF